MGGISTIAKRIGGTGLLGIFTMLSTLASLSSTVSAASPWDNLIHVWSNPLQICQTVGSDCTDVTTSYLSLMTTKCATAASSFVSAVNDPDGHWVIQELTGGGSSMLPSSIRIGWYVGSGSSSLTQFYSNGYPANYKVGVYATRFVDLYWNGTANDCYDYGTGSYISDYAETAFPYKSGVYLSTYPVTYPSGYEGESIADGTAIDEDGDGLNVVQELKQGTSDGSVDTDGDGVGYYRTSSDYAESVWNPNRESEFCNTAVTPHVCAYPDPAKKDLYVQIDWLNNGTTSYKPTTTQLGLVSAKYADLGINFHADTGDYGGGNEISSTEQPTTIAGDLTGSNDFYNHKYGNGVEAANFDVTNRYKIWRYMISGYNFDDGTNGSSSLSAIAETGGDDVFIAYGLLASTRSGSTLDNAIAGTIIHELGHNLCLSDTSTYVGQNSSCVFSGIDNNFASSNYQSAMNYDNQFTNNYSYSDGSHGTGDHNDLAAIAVGFGDYAWNDDDSSVGGL